MTTGANANKEIDVPATRHGPPGAAPGAPGAPGRPPPGDGKAARPAGEPEKTGQPGAERNGK